jgi:hypothetical protein
MNDTQRGLVLLLDWGPVFDGYLWADICTSILAQAQGEGVYISGVSGQAGGQPDESAC